MASTPRDHPVYSTAGGRLCPKCGWPEGDCRCSTRFDETVPEKIVAKLRIEKGGRGGKTVTVVGGLPQNTEFLSRLLSDLKRACGAGGTVAESAIEIQGDQRERVRALLVARGFVVKG